MTWQITWKDLWGYPRDELRNAIGRSSGCIIELHGTLPEDHFLGEAPGLVCDDLEGLEWGT
jgi:hypothetical protein